MGIESSYGHEASRSERLEHEYHAAMIRYDELRCAVSEAELLWHERVAANDGERAMARLTLEQDGLRGEAEASAQRGEPSTERAFRMLEQLVDAETRVLGLYLDALQESPELAARIKDRHPWVVERLRDAANDAAYVAQKSA